MRLSKHFFFLGLAFFSLLVGCNTQTSIVNNLSEREANEIVVLLNSKGIEAQKIPATVSAVGGGATTSEQFWDIAVPPKTITEALSILNQAGLPRIKGTSLLSIFGSQGLVPSELQDRIRYQEGLSEQLATTIRKMDGVIDANVQITFPKDEEEGPVLTASVYVKHRGIIDNPNSITITKIKRLIASAVPNLTIDNVSVVSDRALFADISFEPIDKLEHERRFVSIWTVVVATESAMRFRIIFYAFLILLFVFASALVWFFWKFFPVIKKGGGFKSLFHPEQYGPESFAKKEPEEEKQEEGGAEK